MPGFNEHKLLDLQAKIDSLEAKNERLASALTTTRERLVTLQKSFEQIGQGPAQIGLVIETGPGPQELTVSYGSKEMILPRHPRVAAGDCQPGTRVRISEELVVVDLLSDAKIGQLVTISELLPGQRALVQTSQTDTVMIRLAQPLTKLDPKLEVGDSVVADLRFGFAWERIERGEVEQLLTPQLPEVSFAQIGGLSEQIEQIRDAVELPFKHPELYQKYGLSAPRGILLYGPPGCGKTLIAKAIATQLGQSDFGKNGAFFLSIKGPQLLSKFVGETERQIRAIFRRARELASEEYPVVVFFDEMEALFRTRGSGVSSDVETMIVPQLLTELDGIEKLANVIVIGASNREDMIDPAVLRPGRLDVRIRIDRPSLEEAGEIFLIHLGPEVPLAFVTSDLQTQAQARTQALVELQKRLLDLLGSSCDETALYQVKYSDQQSEICYAKDFLSGAMIAAIVERAKKLAIKDDLHRIAKKSATVTSVEKTGMKWEHLRNAVIEEIRQTALVGANTNLKEWSRVQGQTGRTIIEIKPVLDGKAQQ